MQRNGGRREVPERDQVRRRTLTVADELTCPLIARERLTYRIREFEAEIALRKANQAIGGNLYGTESTGYVSVTQIKISTAASEPIPRPLSHLSRKDSLSSIAPSTHLDTTSALPSNFLSLNRPRQSDVSDISMRSAGTSLNNSTSSTTSATNRSALSSANDQNDYSGMVIDDENENDEEASLWRTFDGVDVSETAATGHIHCLVDPTPLRSIENVSGPAFIPARPHTPPPPAGRIIVPDTPPLARGSPSYIDIPSSPERSSPRRRSPRKLQKEKAKAIDLDEDPAPRHARPSTADEEKRKLAQLKKSPYYAEALKVLKQRFRLPSFRMNQLEAVLATLGGRDTFVLMPTGGLV